VQLTKESFHGSYADAGGFASDQNTSLGDALRFEYADSWTTESAYVGWFARINYAIQRKYLLDFTARYDGSSRFGEANRYGFFPAISAGWILSEEPFFKVKGVDFLKLRSSVGLTGNADIGDFAYLSSTSFAPKYLNEPGFIIQSYGNKDLTWEKNLQWDAGLDFSLWKNRLRGSLDYFIKDTRDLLLNAPVPATNGVSFLIQNVGTVRNQGFEFSLSADILRGAFQWTVQVNGATLKNEVLKLADNDGDGTDDDFVTNNRMLYRRGESVGSFFLVEYAGVDPANGDALFYDLEGNMLANEAPSSNRKIAGKSIPSFTGGFTNTFRFKNFDFSAFFHFKTGHKIYLEHNQFYIGNNMLDGLNQLKGQLNAWTPTNPITDVPQARLGVVNGSQPSTRYLDPADYLRLSHLTFGYTFNKLGDWKSQLRLFAAAQNLLTITNFSGLDPDGEFYPADDSGQGAVRYNLPAARTCTFGFNLEF
jgi:TonB-linked SusC/RagA family outer membrane protein